MRNMTRHIPQLIMAVFLLVMAVTAVLAGIPSIRLMNDSIIRLAMNGVLVLSLIPMLNVGAGINYGLPVAISSGLLGMSMAVNLRLESIIGFLAAVLFSILVGCVFGYAYARVLNRVKGREEIAGIFTGFSFVFLMSFFWAVAPFTNPAMLWPIGGKGMRPTIGLTAYFEKALNHLWAVQIGDLIMPFGLLAFFGLLSWMVYALFKTKLGLAILAVGENELFARLAGININKTRTYAIMMSTVLGAIGICVYAQSYGFIELYEAPLMMAFPAASAILLGGSMGKKTSIFQAILGTFLFQTIYVYTGPIANTLLVPEVSEIIRVIISNGIILYALLYEGGGKRIEKA
ncbi:branched-chain amino acid transport system permease protein livm [hydrocarbon metagenome]|uniref:Branched-chain amino acid transport system permease protein livm n=1 Tax=hydrocarbon metagenome TaxID=938273 RepID=A0A0W8E914_9ZZZZ